jgi:putative ABC transport system substrate-binding protein
MDEPEPPPPSLLGAPIVGFLHSGAEKRHVENVAAFNHGLAEAGYVDEDDVDVRYRWANNDLTKLATNVAAFVAIPANVIVAAGGPQSAQAAMDATTTIPIVFTTVSEPKPRFVNDYEKPGKNLTGTAGLTSELDPERLKLLRELLPTAANVGVLKNPDRPDAATEWSNLQAAASGFNLVPGDARIPTDIPTTLNSFTNVDAVFVTADQLFNNERKAVIKSVQVLGKPAIYQWRDFVEVRGLMSYGPNIKDAYYQTGIYVGREKYARDVTGQIRACDKPQNCEQAETEISCVTSHARH